jgi:anti-sigma regulatory factor (Ser/Thr protein kinase)
MKPRVAQGGAQMRLEISDQSQVGACRRAAQNLAGAWQLPDTAVGRVGIVATELASNLIRHAGGGEILLQPIEYGGRLEIEVLSVDRGPGMLAEQCLRDGFSTAGGPGTGLGAVRRLSAAFDLYSQPEAGTVVLARIDATESRPRRARAAPLELGMISRALRGEPECGDTWSLAERSGDCALLVVDGLGHGAPAALAAGAAAAAFSEQPFASPEETLRTLHRRLAGTRGAAAACALVGADGARLHYAGAGNIAGRLIEGEAQKGLLSYSGTLGLTLARVKQLEYPFPPRSLLVMHSDGLSARWSLAAYPELATRHAAVIAAVLYRDHARDNDDATVTVLRRAA